MSHITITSENLSRFNKRLQKALKKEFNQEVQLHTASTLFANALGVEGEYQLKNNLDLPIANTNCIYLTKAQNLIKDFEEYFNNNHSQLSSVNISYIYDNLAINIASSSQDFANEIEGFGIYFEDNPNTYLNRELSTIKHSHEDRQFLESICQKYFTEDIAENVFIGSRIAKLYDLNADNNNIISLYNTI